MKKELLVNAAKEKLPEVFEFIRNELEESGCSAKTRRQIKLCVEEIFMNISNYAYNPTTGSAKISVEVIKSPEPIRVVISFTDKGVPYDPLAKADPDTQSGLDERAVGGLGIFLVKNTVDGIHYEYKDGQNILTVSKELL